MFQNERKLLTQYTMKSGNNWGTGAIIINDKGELLVGLRTDTHDYCTPGGKVEIGETPEQGMKREIMEESNITVKSYDFVDAYIGAFNNDRLWISFMFVCKDFSGTIKAQESEIVEWKWLPLIEVLQLNLFPPTKKAIEIALEQGYILQ